LHERLGVSSGPEILYVGDHIYGDILRSKKELGWRTMLVINELNDEIESLASYKEEFRQYEELIQIKDELDDEIQKLQVSHDDPTTDTSLNDRIANLIEKRNSTREAMRRSMKKYHQNFHPIWGQLMKTGHQNSRFAAQVENYACLYTSQLTNLCNYSPNHSFRSTRDFMPHDFFRG
jgi:hypothetical protein